MTKNHIILTIFILTFLVTFSCKNGKSEHPKNNVPTVNQSVKDTISISKIHKPNSITCDLDGDNLSDTVKIVQSTKNKKYGLQISFGDKRVEYLGLGKKVLGQGFDDFDWVGIFEKAPKGETYWNNVDDGGEIITEDVVIKESDKVKLLNDGIFIHASESCGGGVIYLKNGKFDWIQQE
jgi:hypothetical protein